MLLSKVCTDCAAGYAEKKMTQRTFSSLQVGELLLKHRIVLAPLTRFRAEKNTHIPRALMEDYYEQRTTPGGLLITEATFISTDAGGYPHVPGIYTPDQIAKWSKITDRVHKKGGHIFCQLWHIGRAAHSSNIGKQIVSSSAIAIKGRTTNSEGKTVPCEVPRELTIPEIKEIVQIYKTASENAMKAGFDGVEIHSANGYLPDQFLEDGVNKRTDEYGGSIANRCRFVLEIVDAISSSIGAKKVGIRFSPWGTFQSMHDSDPTALFTYVINAIQDRHPHFAYVHFVEPRVTGDGRLKPTDDPNASLVPFRKAWKGVFMSAGGYDAKSGVDQIESGRADLVAFGRLFLANPDLVKRIEKGFTLNAYDRSTFYTNDAKGYVDYPFYDTPNLVSNL